METKEIIERLEKQNYLLEKRYEILKTMICDIYDEIVQKKKICPVCNHEIRFYLPFGKPRMRSNAECPACHCLKRQRLLWRFLNANWRSLTGSDVGEEGKKVRILHFAPDASLQNKFANMEGVEYYPVDIDPNYPLPIVNTVDMQSIPYSDEYFDLIIAVHVIQNVEDEKKALKEVRRVLKLSGSAIINSPIDHNLEKTIDERYDTPELREKNYEKEYYQRRYGVDYGERLRLMGGYREVSRFKAEELNTPEEMEYYALLSQEEIYVCKK